MLFDAKDAQAATKRVVRNTANAVIATMGPDGMYSVINHGGNPKATKDGVTVCGAIQYDKPEEDLISRILTEAAMKTDFECGDGTTTTVFLTSEFYEAFSDQMTFINKRKLTQYVDEVIKVIEKHSLNVTVSSPELMSLARTTSNNDERIASNVLSIFRDYPGAEIRCQEGRQEEDVIDVAEGLTLLAYYASPVFSPNGANAPSLIANFIPIVIDNNLKRLSGNQEEELMKMVIEIHQAGPDTPIVIFGRNFDNEFVQCIVRINNKLKAMKIICCAVVAAGSSGTGVMGDIARVFDANVYSELLDYRGSVPTPYKDSILISSSGVVVRDPSPETLVRINERVAHIREEISALPPEKVHTSYGNILRSRVNRLIGGEVTIYVGGITTSDIKERIDRYVDVSKAVKAALTNGIIPGCGYALILAAEDLELRYAGDKLFDKFKAVLCKQYEYLMNTRYVGIDKMRFTDLATGKESHNPQLLEIYDATKALTTALSGGLKTAIILSSVSSIVLGNRYGSVRISV